MDWYLNQNKHWIVAVKSENKIIGMEIAIQKTVLINNKETTIAEFNLLCIHKSYRNDFKLEHPRLI